MMEIKEILKFDLKEKMIYLMGYKAGVDSLCYPFIEYLKEKLEGEK